MDAAMNVGVFIQVVAVQRIDHHLRLLARGRVVEIDQRLAMNLPLQDREIFADFTDIERAVRHPSAARGEYLTGHLHSASFTLWLCGNQVNMKSLSVVRSGSSLIRCTSSLANAYVSKLRAASSPRPRERR